MKRSITSISLHTLKRARCSPANIPPRFSGQCVPGPTTIKPTTIYACAHAKRDYSTSGTVSLMQQLGAMTVLELGPVASSAGQEQQRAMATDSNGHKHYAGGDNTERNKDVTGFSILLSKNGGKLGTVVAPNGRNGKTFTKQGKGFTVNQNKRHSL